MRCCFRSFALPRSLQLVEGMHFNPISSFTARRVALHLAEEEVEAVVLEMFPERWERMWGKPSRRCRDPLFFFFCGLFCLWMILEGVFSWRFFRVVCCRLSLFRVGFVSFAFDYQVLSYMDHRRVLSKEK